MAVDNAKSKAFTLIETLASVAIIAALTVMVVPWIANLVQTAKTNADKQTLWVLNEALTRYKCQGGDINALTSGAAIRTILAKLQAPTSFAGTTHVFLQTGKTFRGKSIDVKGTGRQYRFTRYNTYTEEAGGTSPTGTPLFVVVASGSDNAAYSFDGINWEAAKLPSSANWYYVAYGNGTFVTTAGGSNKAAWSTDGKTWTAATLPSSVNWHGVSYGNGRFTTGTYSSNKTAYSNDNGKTWVAGGNMPITSGWDFAPNSYGTVNGISRLVANSYSGTRTAAAYSDDGINWTQTTMPGDYSWEPCAYGPVNGIGRYVTVALYSTNAAYTDDGINWTLVTGTGRSALCAIVYGGGKFVVVPYDSAAAAYSTNGINWSPATMPSSGKWGFVAYGNGVFVATNANSGNTAAYSTNGINWTTITLPATTTWYGIAARQ